jgi:cold shock CspA family protein
MSATRLTGSVKWFNNKAGYGFIKVIGDESESESDVFVHYSNIKVEGLEYTYLVQGEYIEFEKAETDNEEHKFQAVNLSGIKGGPLLCQTRYTNRPLPRTDYEERRPSSARVLRREPSTRGPSRNDDEDREFTRVVSRKPRAPAPGPRQRI